MNIYQKQLATIQARRLTQQQRLYSLFAFIGLLLLASYFIPAGIISIWLNSGLGYEVNSPSAEWLQMLLLSIHILLSLLLLFFVFYMISRALKQLVRFLSGIKEN